jgi:ribosomal protein S8
MGQMDQDQSDKKTWQATKKAAEVTYATKHAGCLDDLNEIEQEELANKKKVTFQKQKNRKNVINRNG